MQKQMHYGMFVLGLIVAIFLSPLAEAKKLNIVTATTDMAALAQEVGGDRVSVESIAAAIRTRTLSRPSRFLLKLRQADLLILVGLQLEIGWLPPLITQVAIPEFNWCRRLSGCVAVC